MKKLFFTAFTLIITLMISACSPNQYHNKKHTSNEIIINIINHDNALRQIDMPICHFEGC